MGVPIINKVLDKFGNLKPEYCNVRYSYTSNSPWGANVFHDYELSVEDAVDTAVFNRHDLKGLAKVEWRGAHIGDEWRDVTAVFERHYRETMNNAK